MKRSIKTRHLARIASVIALLLVPSAAAGQTASPEVEAAARSLFQQGQERLQAGAVAEACSTFEEVTRMKPDWVGAQLWLADCYERGGRLASAWSLYGRAEALAVKAARAGDQTLARQRADALAPRLSRLEIDVPDAVAKLPQLSVKRDGEPVGAAQFGVALPVDAGKHRIEITAAGKKPWQREVEVRDGASVEHVSVASLEDEPVSAGAGKGVAPPGNNGSEGADAGPSGVPTWAWALGGAGLAMGAASVGFLVDERGVQSDIDAHCGEKTCDTKDGFAVDDANSHLWRSYGLFVGFGAASLLSLGAAAYGITTAPRGPVGRERGSAAAWIPEPFVAPGASGVVVRGRFE